MRHLTDGAVDENARRRAEVGDLDCLGAARAHL